MWPKKNDVQNQRQCMRKFYMPQTCVWKIAWYIAVLLFLILLHFKTHYIYVCISCFGFKSNAQKNIHLYVCMGNWTLERKFGEKQCCHSQQALICHSPTIFFCETMFLVKQSETGTSVDVGTLRHMIIDALNRSDDFFMVLQKHSLLVCCVCFCCCVSCLSCTNNVGAI